MYYYQICGLNVASGLELEQAFAVPEFAGPQRDVWVHEGHIDEEFTADTEEDLNSGAFFRVRYAKMKGCVRVIGHGCLYFQNGNEIIYQLKDGYNPFLISEVVLCLCIGVLMIQRNRIVLHGSGISWMNRAVIISGKSGSGKSTLTEAMLRKGAGFMADDFVALSLEGGTVWAHPSFPQQKLCADAAEAYDINREKLKLLPAECGDDAKEKYALRITENYCSHKKELQAVIILQVSDDEPKGAIEKITGAEKIKYITDNLYKYNAYLQMGLSRSMFMEGVQIANNTEIFKLVRPPKNLTVEEELAMVLEALS